MNISHKIKLCLKKPVQNTEFNQGILVPPWHIFWKKKKLKPISKSKEIFHSESTETVCLIIKPLKCFTVVLCTQKNPTFVLFY